jgi:hypothetical protein
MRLADALILLVVLSVPARADFATILPTSYTGVQSITYPGQAPSYVPAMLGNSVGYGQGISPTHVIVNDVKFDFSGVEGTIIGLELTGRLTSLSTVLGAPYVTYAQLFGSITLPQPATGADPQSIFNAVTSGAGTGGFAVDNRLILNVPRPLGSTVTASISPNAIPQDGTLFVGFVGTSAFPFSPGVQGVLSVQLIADIVPEPTSLCLTGLGFALLAYGQYRWVNRVKTA